MSYRCGQKTLTYECKYAKLEKKCHTNGTRSMTKSVTVSCIVKWQYSGGSSPKIIGVKCLFL